MTLNELLDEAKKITGSDYKTAIAIGLKGQHISNWRKHRCKPNSDSRIQLANLLHMTTEELSAHIALESETNEEKRNYWKKIGGIAAALVLSIALHPAAEHISTLYIM